MFSQRLKQIAITSIVGLAVATPVFTAMASEKQDVAITLPPAPNSDSMQHLAQRLYELSVQEQMPLNDSQIRQFIDQMRQTSEAMRPANPPQMRSRTERLVLRPGSEAPVVQLVPGYVSTLTFADATGAPWPLTSVSNGNAKWFHVVQPELPNGNMLTISPLARHADSNITVTLANETLPVVIRLCTDDRQQGAQTDSLVSMQIAKRGPNATDPVVGGHVESAVSPTMLAFLDGVPPAGAKTLVFHPAKTDVDLWRHEDRYYLRSRYEAVWPAWSDMVSGAGGFRVYQIPPVPSCIVSINGRTEILNIGDE
ncbi:MAG: DotH/IcmK family type IV secretion protein [Syntrophotalea acetylenica]|nr:DotH/IcmK family type IV secretion protein [Syntrophotalea acetylenica]